MDFRKKIENYYIITGLDHLIKIHSKCEKRVFSFENIEIKMKDNNLVIYNNLKTYDNFFTTNTCCIVSVGGLLPEHLDVEQFLNTLYILYKNKIKIVLTNTVIKLLLDIFRNHNCIYNDFSYRNICQKYKNCSNFYEIIETELILNSN